MPIAPSQSSTGAFQTSKAGALNPRLSTSMVLSVDVSSIEADGAHVTLSAAVSKAFFSNPPGPMPAAAHTAPTGYETDTRHWHEWAPGYEPQPGYEKQPTGSGKVTFYNSGLGTTLKSITDNIAKVTTADPHGFTVGAHVGIMVGSGFDPVDVEIIEAEDDWFTFDARPLGDAGPDVPDVAEAAFTGTVMPVIAGVDIDTTGTWDIDNPESASPQAVYSLTLPIAVLLSDSWPSVDIDCRLNIITAYYSGTVDWQPCLLNLNIFWPDFLYCADLAALVPGWSNPQITAVNPGDVTVLPCIKYPRHWGNGGFQITVTKDAPATLEVTLGSGLTTVVNHFVKSDDYDQNPIGEFTCTGATYDPEWADPVNIIPDESVVHVTQRADWTMHVSDLSDLADWPDGIDWPDPPWHYRTMRLFSPEIIGTNLNGDWFARVDSDSDFTGTLYLNGPSFPGKCILIVRRGNAYYSTSVFGYFVKSDSDLTNPVGEYTCGGYGPGGVFAGTVLEAGGVIHVTSG